MMRVEGCGDPCPYKINIQHQLRHHTILFSLGKKLLAGQTPVLGRHTFGTGIWIMNGLRMVYISIALSMLSLHMFQPLVANTALRNTMLTATSRGAPFKPRMLL